MRPGIVAALVPEARTLARGPIKPGELIHLAEDAILIVSGIGARCAGRGARTLLAEGATALVSWGTAGGLCPDLSPGSLILPKKIIESNRSIHSTDPFWHEQLCSRLGPHVRIHTGDLAESLAVLHAFEAKKTLHGLTGAIGVDMESAAIAAAAKEAGVPFMALRAVADRAEMTIPLAALNSIDSFGRVRLWKLIEGLARNPIEISGMCRMGWNFKLARATLAKVALHAGGSLLCPGADRPAGDGA